MLFYWIVYNEVGAGMTLAGARRFPTDVSPVHFIRLELANADAHLIFSTFYWRSNNDYKPSHTWTVPENQGFEELSKLPPVKFASEVRWSRDGDENVCEVIVKNPSQSLAFMVWLRLQHAADANPVRPVLYGDNFCSLLPGESRTVRIQLDNKAANPKQVELLVDSWNAVRKIYRLNNSLAS